MTSCGQLIANINCNKNIKAHRNKLGWGKIILILLIFASFILVLTNPTKYIESAKRGLYLWGNSVVPSLFPFMFLTKILIAILPKKLCKPEVYVFALSSLSGYPISAKLLSDYYKNGEITRRQVEKIYSYSSTSGPVFVIGTVGSLFFGSAVIGVVMFCVHIVATLLTGLVFGGFKKEKVTKSQTKASFIVDEEILSSSVLSSIQSILVVGAYIVLFYVLFDVLCSTNLINFFVEMFNLFGVDKNISSGLFSGLIELTRGVSELGKINGNLAICVSGALISFSGLCIILQSYTFLQSTGVKFCYVLAVKIVQAIFTFCLLWGIFCFT